MSGFLSTKTLDTDDEADIVDEESESETTSKKKSKKTKKSKKSEEFSSDFSFSVGSTELASGWKINEALKKSAKGDNSSLEVVEEQIKQKLKEKNNECELKEEVLSEDDDINEELSSEDENQDEDESYFSKAPPIVHKAFAQMNLSRPLLKAINGLGFEQPTKIQSSTIPVALLGKDLCACATTGSGKTAAFMLPILERLLFKPEKVAVVRVLVLVPTRELAIQVHQVAEALAKHTNIQIGLATGGLDSRAQEAALRKNPDVVVATPGRLIDHLYNTPSFSLQTVEILVLDEADRMLEEHFQDQMKEIIQLSPRGRQTMLFSATMTDEVESLMTLSLNNPVKLFVDQNTDFASSLRQEFVRIRSSREKDRLSVAAALVCRSFHEHTLVFLQTKVLAHKLRIILGLMNIKVAELHGNLTQYQRLDALEKFKTGEVDVLVATDLAARGLDIAAVKTVISLNLPTTIKSYIHRVGRTARAGKFGRSITLVGEKERKMLKEVVKSSKAPVKNRIIPASIIDKYNEKISSLEKDVKDILKNEETEKETRIAEMEMNKAENLVKHHDEIMSRPAKAFIKPSKQNKVQTKAKNTTDNMTDEEKKCRHEQLFLARQMKRAKKPKRLRAIDEIDPPPKKKGFKQAKLVASKKTFDRELTDTSKKSLNSLRNLPAATKKKTSGFKSKGRYRRK